MLWRCIFSAELILCRLDCITVGLLLVCWELRFILVMLAQRSFVVKWSLKCWDRRFSLRSFVFKRLDSFICRPGSWLNVTSSRFLFIPIRVLFILICISLQSLSPDQLYLIIRWFPLLTHLLLLLTASTRLQLQCRCSGRLVFTHFTFSQIKLWCFLPLKILVDTWGLKCRSVKCFKLIYTSPRFFIAQFRIGMFFSEAYSCLQSLLLGIFFNSLLFNCSLIGHSFEFSISTIVFFIWFIFLSDWIRCILYFNFNFILPSLAIYLNIICLLNFRLLDWSLFSASLFTFIGFKKFQFLFLNLDIFFYLFNSNGFKDYLLFLLPCLALIIINIVLFYTVWCF